MYTTPSPRFDITDPNQAIAFDQYLEEYGYAVVAAVANKTEIINSKKLFWDFMEEHPSTKLLRHDSNTWYSPNWLPHPGNGIISYIGQSDFCWSLRTLPKVQTVFQRIWNTKQQMICSFDGGCAFRPWQKGAMVDRRWLVAYGSKCSKTR